MRILIVQTTRMGDVLQTSPLVRMIRHQYPDAHIAMLTRGMGQIIAKRHPDLNEVMVYDENEMFLDMRAQDSDRLLKAYRAAEDIVSRLKDAKFDLAYNVTHSLASAMLLKMAGIPRVIGAHLSDDGDYILRGRWTNYFFTSVFNRDYNDLNLCDITRNFAGEAPACRELIFALEKKDHEFVNELFAMHQIGVDDFVCCLQLGASERNKQWPPERYAELARLLTETYGARIFLVGVKEEQPLGDAFLQHAPGSAIPLFGQSSIPQVTALLARSRLLVTNDTGTMHLAAAVNCPIALVSVGHVHYRETGPYGAGHCAIEWRREKLGRSAQISHAAEERSRILPAQVMTAIATILAPGNTAGITQLPVTPALKTVDLYQSHFAPDGCLCFYPVLRRPLEERDFLRIAYRFMWLHHLSSNPESINDADDIRDLLAYYDAPHTALLIRWNEEMPRMFAGLAALFQKGLTASDALIKMLKGKASMVAARDAVRTLTRLDEEARVHSEMNPPCKPLTTIARYERDNLEGADPVRLAETTRQIYADGHARATLMHDKLETLLRALTG